MFVSLVYLKVWVFLLIVAVTGSIGGALYDPERPLAGLVGGAAMSMGALGATQAFLCTVNSTHTVVLTIIGLVGALPGLGIYFLAKAVIYRD